jgi:hypothetical protein
MILSMAKGNSSAAPVVRSWQVRDEGCSTSALTCRRRRRRWGEAKGTSRIVARTVRRAAEVRETTRAALVGSAHKTGPNYPVHVTAARLRFLLNVKGYIWAAARDGER